MQPNIILINCDDLGYGDLGCYGSDVNQTPAIDQMAAEGKRFTDFYMASPVCSPSRASMLTGCYPPRIGFGEFNGNRVLYPGDSIGLNPKETTIAKLLKSAGYATKIIGKWHCGDQQEFLPTNHGFDSYFGIPYSNDMGIQIGKKSKCFPPLPLVKDEKVVQLQPDQTGLTELYVKEALDFMFENRNKPFFMYFAHMYVHLPIYVQKHFLKKSTNGTYGAAIASIDWVTEVILKKLKSLGIDENTMVIFTSDNGSRVRGEGGSNAPLRGTKGTTWEGGMRVPCIMRWPGRIVEGTTCTQIATSMDLYPTLSNLGGANLPSDRKIDGVDLSSIIFDDDIDQTVRNDFFYYNGNYLAAVRSGNWKLHVLKPDTKEMNIRELYDLESDVSESNNLYDDYPDIVDDLTEKLNFCRKDIGDQSFQKSGENIRTIGEVKIPTILSHCDPSHPIIVAMYDIKDRG